MALKTSVKVQTIIENQIPDFLRSDSPLFTEFLKQYYTSQEFPTGNNDISVNIHNYKNIDSYSKEVFYTKKVPCKLTENLLSFSDEIFVTSTLGFPQKYGLLKINDEIITYTNKTDTKFLGCIRGFSGITKIDDGSLTFDITSSKNHFEGDEVVDLNLIFYEKLFEKFKAQYIPDFYNREVKVDYDILLSTARDFYLTKGTDVSYKLLFNILYGTNVSIIKPEEYLISPSDDRELITRNILVEFLDNFDFTVEDLIGKSIYQNLDSTKTASASIYNIEYRPLDDLNIFEISLDSESVIYDFDVTKRSYVSRYNLANNSIIVDSTFGFSNTGECIVIPKAKDKQRFNFTYTDRTLTQFMGVSSEFQIEPGDIILDKSLGYIFLDNSVKLHFRIISVIEDFNLNSSLLLQPEDVIKLSTFGEPELNYFTKSLITNYDTIHTIEKIEASGDSISIKLLDYPKLFPGEEVRLLNSNYDIIANTQVSSNTPQNRTITIPLIGVENLSTIVKLQKVIKTSSLNENIPSFIQDSYISSTDNSYYVTSNGLPNFGIPQTFENYKFNLIPFGNVGVSTTILRTTKFNSPNVNIPHNLSSGDKITLVPINGDNFREYFVKSESSTTISLYESQKSILNNIPLEYNITQTLRTSGIGVGVYDGFTQTYDDYKSQKLIKKIKFPVGISTLSQISNKTTKNRQIGILINGVELVSPDITDKSYYYGEVDSISILNPGDGYDVITPPRLLIKDINEGSSSGGSSAKVHPHMKGHLLDVLIKSKGVNYQIKPEISLVGGNLSSEVGFETNFKRIQVTSEFITDLIVSNVIIVLENHLFDSGEEVIYSSNSNQSVNGLVDGNSYFIGTYVESGVVDYSRLRLFSSRNDALEGNISNAIPLIPGSSPGIHRLSSVNTKTVIDGITFNSTNIELDNKIIYIPAINEDNNRNLNGISLLNDYIYAKNHNFRDKDCVEYSRTGSTIIGLNTTSKYLVTVIDKNRFKLSQAGSGDFPNTSNYDNKVYVNMTGVGTGVHCLSTPKIQLKVKEFSSSQNPIIPLELEPIVLGKIDYVFIENYGSNYGTKEIINYHKRPRIDILNRAEDDTTFSSDSVLAPIIQNGRIVSVRILNSGRNYRQNIELEVTGEGKYAKLYPIISGGEIVEVKILNPGLGYSPNTTEINIKFRGSGGSILANIKKWTLNQYTKYIATITNATSGGGILIPSKYQEGTAQFVNILPPIRLINLVSDLGYFEGNYLILGWSYDGCPIVYPKTPIQTGYRIQNSLVNQLNSSNKRPNISAPSGTFMEDYIFFPDETILDENNGLYIENDPSIPDGTYAYIIPHTLLNGTVRSPYIVGPEFKFSPEIDNFNYTKIQTNSLNNLELIKNTYDLFLNSKNSKYLPVKEISEGYLQEFKVSEVIRSGITDCISPVPGTGYKVGELIEFDSEDMAVILPEGLISSIRGKEILQVAISTITNSTEFRLNGENIVGITTLPHNLKSDSFVQVIVNTSGISSNYTNLNGIYQISVGINSTKILNPIPSSGAYANFRVSDISSFIIGSFVKIDNEIFKIIGIYLRESKVKAIRGQLNTSIASHISGRVVTEIPRRFEFTTISNKEYTLDNNIRYFNPSEAIGIGTSGKFYTEVGVGSIYIPPRAVYIPNHGFKTNERIVYDLDMVGLQDSPILVSNTESESPYQINKDSVLYAQNFGPNLVGIKTTRSSSPIYFRSDSILLGEAHFLRRYQNSIVGITTNERVVITTKTPHKLQNSDPIQFPLQTDEDFPIFRVNPSSFEVNIKDYELIQKLKQNLIKLTYTTTSLHSDGPINTIKLTNKGNLHKKLPYVKKIHTETGRDAEIIPITNKIGKVNRIERVKDGYDYPSDSTFSPKLSSIYIIYVKNSYKINTVDVLYGGVNYITPPTLIPLNVPQSKRSEFSFTPVMDGGTVDSVIVNKTPIDLSSDIELLSVNNSNGFEILSIQKLQSPNTRIRLILNFTTPFYSDEDFPIQSGDLILIENCRVSEGTGINYNSSATDYTFYPVSEVNLEAKSIILNTPIPSNEYGDYDINNGYGSLTIKSKLPRFKINLIKTDYQLGESVYVSGAPSNKFTGVVIGWDENLSQLRVSDSLGKLDVGDKIIGELSTKSGVITYYENFVVTCSLNASREKINYLSLTPDDLNTKYKKLQDSEYYQKFSYSLLSVVPYENWKEPVRSIIHPLGYKEFSDLSIISKVPDNTKSLAPTLSQDDVNLVIKIDNEDEFKVVKNYTIGYDASDQLLEDGFSERVFFGSGSENWPIAYGGNQESVNNIIISPYVQNSTNEVTILKDISAQFVGTYEYSVVGIRTVTFNSSTPYSLGVNTTGLQVGDLIGISTLLNSSDFTRIVSILPDNKIEILSPHKNYSGSINNNIQIFRILDQNNLVGVSSFILKDINDREVLKISISSSNIDLNNSSIPNYNIFKKGQKIDYRNIGGTPIEIQSTSDVLGGISTTILPNTIYIYEANNNGFRLAGLPDSTPFVFTSVGTGNHTFSFNEPNKHALITIDNIIQIPLSYRLFDLILEDSVDENDTSILILSDVNYLDVNYLRSDDILLIDDEYLSITNIGIGGPNEVSVRRGTLGSSPTSHSQNSIIKVYSGNYNIKEDIIYFTSPPLGPSIISGSSISSKFSGRLLTRNFNIDDSNKILDDTAPLFIDSNEFVLLENGNSVVGIFTNANNIETSANISNNPIILINNVIQAPETGFTLQDPVENKIVFTRESPKVGKIYKYEYSLGGGYAPLVGASATAILSSSGGVVSIALNGVGSGYREPPEVKIRSISGVGASIVASVGSGGTITGFNVVLPGVGYNTEGFTYVDIDSPLPYNDLLLEYDNASGIGSLARVSVKINESGEIDYLNFIDYGGNYVNGETLKIVGLVTTTESFTEAIITVKETFDDKFSGLYYGQLIKCKDISPQFNSQKTLFDVFTIIDGIENRIIFRGRDEEEIENNFIIVINDILQQPGISYRYISGKLYFPEPPKENSSCIILYYVGSSSDYQFIEVLQSFKVGDGIKLNDSPFNNFDTGQRKRVIKGINGPDFVDTFTYADFGVNYLTPKPIDWSRQDSDLIINGELVSKNRLSQNCNIIPSAKLLKIIGGESQDIIYLDNAFPLFNKLDENELTKAKRSIKIIQNTSYSTVETNAIVSSGATISSIDFVPSANKYESPPSVSISLPTLESNGITTPTRAQAEVILVDNTIDSINILDGGYGYEEGKVQVLISSPEVKYEDILSYDVIGDYGKIVGIITYPQGTPGIGTTTPKVSFELQTDYYDINSYPINYYSLNFFGIEYSQLDIGDYFIINNSNVTCGHALTGITAELGAMANYPESKVGTAISFLDGIYRVESVEIPTPTSIPAGQSGIITVTCNFAPNATGGLDLVINPLNSKYYGDYSWSKIFNFEPRSPEKIRDFEINTDQGIFGINQSTEVQRNQPLIVSSNAKLSQ